MALDNLLVTDARGKAYADQPTAASASPMPLDKALRADGGAAIRRWTV
jgi:hypothetical protein